MSTCQDTWGILLPLHSLLLVSLKCSMQREECQNTKWLEIFLYLYHLVNKVGKKCHCVIFTYVWETITAVREWLYSYLLEWSRQTFQKQTFIAWWDLCWTLGISRLLVASRKIPADSSWQHPLSCWSQSAERLSTTALTPAQRTLPWNSRVSWWAISHHQISVSFYSAGNNQIPKAYSHSLLEGQFCHSVHWRQKTKLYLYTTVPCKYDYLAKNQF